MPSSRLKIVVSGRLVELYEYEYPVFYNYASSPTKRTRRERAKAAQDADPSVIEATHRAARKLKRLCFSNSWQWKDRKGQPLMPIFVTFTFRENVTDITYAHDEFSKMVERLNYQWRDFLPDGLKYVVVPERQKRGALHYHLLAFNLPYIPMVYDWIAKIWTHGFAKIEKVRSGRKLSSYISKYLGKDLSSGREFNGKRYFSSRALLQPIQFRRPVEVNMILDEMPNDIKPWQTTIKPDRNSRAMTGEIRYSRFILPNNLELISVEDAFGETEKSPTGHGNAKMMPPTGGPDSGLAQESHINNPNV